MTKISSQPAYKPDTEITGKDYLVGTDADKANKPTVSFLLEDLGRHFNMVNGSRNFDYLFYNHLGVSQAPANGCFYSNDNEQNPNNITHFFISKYTSSNKDVSQFFDSITTTNPFDLIVSQKIGLNSIFFFTISDVESINGYYKLTVSEKFFPDSLIVEYKASNLVFNLKPNSESIHNNLSGLNAGDFKHLTALEKTKFDNLPNTFITNHSQLSLNDGTNPHGTTKTDVGLSNVNNTSDADKPVSTAQQTALNLKQDNLTETNFGTFSNGLTTNDSIVDSDLINYTDVSDSNKQKKTTWANIKAKLASIFLTKVSTVDVEKVYIKNADGTQGMKPTSDLVVGGSEIQNFITYGNRINLETIGNFYCSEIQTGLTTATIISSPGNVLASSMAIRWVMPIMFSNKSQELRMLRLHANNVNFTSLRLVVFIGQRLNGSGTRINNIVIHDENITLVGGFSTVNIERTAFTNTVTIPQGYELCFLLSRLNGTGSFMDNFQISGYAS